MLLLDCKDAYGPGALALSMATGPFPKLPSNPAAKEAKTLAPAEDNPPPGSPHFGQGIP